MKILFSPPDIGKEEIDEVVDTLKSGWITTGPKTKIFEQKIAEYCKTGKAVCLNSATACMELTLRILGIGQDDEVIVPAYTYTATASAVYHTGATPILVDSKRDSFEMDEEKLNKAITSKTKAIIPVDLAGIPCDYEKLYKIIEQKRDIYQAGSSIQEKAGRIIVIADAAHAFGAFETNAVGEKIMCGNMADFTCFSFHAVKNLTTAEGGAVTWKTEEWIDSIELYRQYMLLSLHGQTKDALAKNQAGAWEYDIIAPYYKCNMTDIMAALGLGQLKRYDGLLNKRKKIVEIYDNAIKNWNLKNDRKIKIASHITKHMQSSFHLYMIRMEGIDEAIRNQIIIEMGKNEIGVNVHYKPLPLLSAYKNMGYRIEDFPNAYELYQNEITLPLHSNLSEEEARYVMRVLFSILQNNI